MKTGCLQDANFFLLMSAGAKSNYVMGKRLCAALSGKFKDEEQKWWEDRDKGPNGKVAFPNCWRKHADMDEPVEGCVPDTIVEVSLYDLLLAQFSPETDSRAAEIELGTFKWEPFKKVDGKTPLSFISYRSYMERLLRRANKTSAFERVRCIRNTLRKDFKEKTDMTSNEKAVGEKIEVIFVTAEVDTLDQAVTKQCSGCGASGHTVEVCRKTKAKEQANKADGTTKRGSGNGLVCTHCNKNGHGVETCYQLVGKPTKGSTNTTTTNTSSTPTTTTKNASTASTSTNTNTVRGDTKVDTNTA